MEKKVKATPEITTYIKDYQLEFDVEHAVEYIQNDDGTVTPVFRVKVVDVRLLDKIEDEKEGC